jgi:hypothetical protein
LRTLSDAVAASVLANATATCFATIVGAFVPAVFEVNFLGGTGVFTSCFVLFTREIARAPANTDLATPFGVAMPAKRAPYVTAVILVFLGGCNPLEVLSCLYVGNAWAANGIVWATPSDGALAQLENGALRFASRQPGYVAVNGQMLPVVSRDGSSGDSSSSTASSLVEGVVAMVSNLAREARRRFAQMANRSAAPAAATTPAAPATADEAPSASRGVVDTRPKPQTREERAAAFAAAFERRNADDADDADDDAS